MGDGVNKSDNLPKNKPEHDRPKGGTDGQAAETKPEIGQARLGEQGFSNPANNAVGDSVAERCLEDVHTAKAAIAEVRTQDKPPLQNLMRDMLIPVLEGFQPPVLNNAVYKDAVVDLKQKAELLYKQAQEPEKTSLIKYQQEIDKAIMDHKDYVPLLPNTDLRRVLMAYALGDGKDAECDQISNVVNAKYWTDVLSKGGKLLDGNSADPAEKKQWQDQAEILAYLSSLLVKDDNALLHPEQIDRYNPNPKFRPLDEPLPPPENFSHHLPEKFESSLFTVVDKDGKTVPRVFNPRELREKEMSAIFQRELVTGLDSQEQAVLALHKEVLGQVLPWWVLVNKELVKDNDKLVNGAESVRNNILTRYEQDFSHLQNQLNAVLNNNPNFSRDKWIEYQKRAMAEIPSTAQARHSVTEAEAANLTPAQKKERCWDTRNQTDAELARETIRLAEWRYLSALEKAVDNGLLFPEAQVRVQGAQLPSVLLTQWRALHSGTGVNEFKNPSVSEDPARRCASKQLRRDFNQPMADPAVFNEAEIQAAVQAVVKPNQRNGSDGRPIPIAELVNTWEKDNLTHWRESGYPWPLFYVSNTNTNETINRSHRNALQQFPVLDCANNNEARKGSVGIDNNMVNLVRDRGVQQRIEFLRANSKAVCSGCPPELDPKRDPFKNYDYQKDTLLETWRSTIK